MLELYDFEKSSRNPDTYTLENLTLMEVEKESVHLRELPIDAEEVIFASRHASESGAPSLTVHTPGYLDKGELAVSSPPTLRAALLELARAGGELGLKYQVSLEATHHGPVHLEVPVTFVEIGSLAEQWMDKKAGEAAARAIMAAAGATGGCPCAVAVGGPHYAPLHTKVVLNSDIGVGHILPKYFSFDETALEKAIARTRGKADLLLLDRKGATSEQMAICQKTAEKLGIPLVRSGDILSRKT